MHIYISQTNKAVTRNLISFWNYYHEEEVMPGGGGNYFTLLDASEVIWRTVSSVVYRTLGKM